jgi:hypothetical protein
VSEKYATEKKMATRETIAVWRDARQAKIKAKMVIATAATVVFPKAKLVPTTTKR